MKIHVLLIDDNADDAELSIAFCAEAAPHLDFTVVTSATEARTLIAHYEPCFDVLLLDYTLPDTQGLELLDELVAIGYPAPVVMVTGRDDVATAVAAMKAGAMDYLVKAGEYWQQLPRLIGGLVDRYRLVRENRRLQFELARRAEELEEVVSRLQFERARLGAVIEQLPEGVLLVEGLEARTTAANPAAARLLGEAPTPAIALHDYFARYTRNLDGSLRTPEQTIIARVLRSGLPVLGEQVLLLRPNDEQRTVLVNAAPLLDDNGVVRGAVMVFQDISEIKRLEQLKDEILSIASHELKNPLTVLLGYATVLERTPAAAGDERVRRAALIIRQQTLRMRTMIDRMLDLSRLDLGQLELRSAPFDLAALVRMVAEQYQATTDKHLITTRIACEPCMLEGDYTRIEQLLSNLVTNAIKYSPNGGRVEVTLEHRSAAELPAVARGQPLREACGYVLVQVRDEGIGISPDQVARLFDRYYRTSEATHIAAGQGLGLYISSEIARLHGGLLAVESSEGIGSSFSLVLPVNLP